MQTNQNILVVGATGGSGRAAVQHLLAAGHRVTAFSRSAHSLAGLSDRLTTVQGDAADPDQVDRAVRGHDAVVVTLGITENPIRVRLFGAARTATQVRSVGTENVIAAMQRHGVPRLVALTSYGVGETRERLRALDRLIFWLLLKPQIADTERQERVIRGSGIEWVLAQPVHLTDDEEQALPFASTEGQVDTWKVSRGSVGRFLGEAAVGSAYVGRSVALSGRGAA